MSLKFLGPIAGLLWAVVFRLPVDAAQFKTFGDYEVHYTTFPSTLIPTDVAVAHDIVRSEKQIIVNISVRQDEAPAAARISGRVTNLLNQMVVLNFKEVKEATAIYYIANHPVDEKDTLRFDVTVHPDGFEGEPFHLEFLRRYY